MPSNRCEGATQFIPTGPATVVLTTPDDEVLDAAELFAIEELDKLELLTAGLDELELLTVDFDELELETELLFTELTELLDEELLNAVPSIRNQLTLNTPEVA